jgi:hypothetical protein
MRDEVDRFPGASGGIACSADATGGCGGIGCVLDASLYSRQGECGVFMVPVGPAESHVTFSLLTAEGGLGLSVDSEMTDIVVDPRREPYL